MSHLEILLLALILDAIIGDPNWLWTRLPHPAALIGRAISAIEVMLNQGARRRVKGAFLIVVLVTAAFSLGWLLAGSATVEIILIAILLAQNSLTRHVSAVARALETSIHEGRKAVALIVGRDPNALDEPGIIRSAIESGAENFSDGVVAPLFWALFFGLPGILVYKAVNTADSMIGYQTPRYAEFGWAAARLDDVLNFIPARLTGLLIALTSRRIETFQIMRRDAPLHRSPNAGWPEAAAAAALNVAISGPRSYDGVLTQDAFVNVDGRHDLIANDIDRTTRLLWHSWFLMFALLLLVWWLLQ